MTSSKPPTRDELSAAALAAGVDLFARGMQVGIRHWSQVLNTLPKVSDEPQHIGELLSALLARARSYGFDIALGVPAAAERLRRSLEPPAPGAAPVPSETMVHGKRVGLPVSVYDATQGIAVHMVDITPVRQMLRDINDSLEPVDLGSGQTLASLMFVDYLHGDLGRYREIALAFHVVPRGASMQPYGLCFVDMFVDGEFTLAAGQQIWGYPKTLRDMDARYRDDQAVCELYRNGKPALTMTFPTRGRGITTDLPIYTYSSLDGRVVRSLLVRSGAGELLLTGAHVEIDVRDESDAFCQRLNAINFAARPLGCLWTGKMTATLSAPRLV